MQTSCPAIDKKTFDSAYKRAQLAFNLPTNTHIEFKTDWPLAIRYNPERGRHELHTSLQISFVHRLHVKTNLPFEDACFLALAHEAGHFELNQRCADANSDPAYSRNQLAAIGSPLIGIPSKRFVAECHKETSIEAYCDANLINAIYKHFPSSASTLVQAVADIRREDSSKPHRFGDDYKTAIVFDAVASQGFPIPPDEAAKFAFEHSKSSMGHAENLWLTAKRPMLLDFPKAVGELPNKLRALREKAFSSSKPPTNNP